MSNCTRSPVDHVARDRASSVVLAVFASAYAGLGLWYFYHDFFKYLGRDMPTTMDGSGFAVLVNCYAWTVLSPWRVLGLAVALGLLGVSAFKLWRGRSEGRALALFTLWGVVLPQVLWFTEFAIDWEAKRGVTAIALGGLAMVSVPSLLLARGRATLEGWNPVSRGPARLLATAIATAWIAFAATEFLDHSYQFESGTAWWAAALAASLGGVACVGLFRARVWGLVLAMATAGSLAVIPLSTAFSGFMPTGLSFHGSWGFIDRLYFVISHDPIDTTLAAALPLVVVGALAAPFLRSMMRQMAQLGAERS